MVGYEFISLSQEQVEARRKLLDQAGFQAYLAPILILLSIAAYRKLLPVISTGTAKPNRNPSQLELLTRRISWVLNDTYIGEFGPLQVQILGLIYGVFLIFGITYQTGIDYMHVTKAFGHVAVAQLPMHYLLSIKSPISPITLATGLTHEGLNAYHRLFGRILHALLATHAILYLRFFALMNVLPKRIKDWDVRLGIMAIWIVNFLAILSIPPIRRKAYHKVFYRSHVIFSALLLVLLWFHVPYTRRYVEQATVLWVANGILRRGASREARVTCVTSGKNNIIVKANTLGPHLQSYSPGLHVYLNDGVLGPRAPFTVVSARASGKDESEVQLVVTNSGGPMTGSLGGAATSGKQLTLDLEGPYGAAQQYMPDLLKDDRPKSGKFLIVAGGVGATYALPIFKALVSTRKSTSDLKLVWVVHDDRELRWARDFLTDHQVRDRIQIFCTSTGSSDRDLDAGRELVLNAGRPDIAQIVDSFFASNVPVANGVTAKVSRDSETVTVMLCGPSSLARSLRSAVGKHVMGYGKDVRYHEEQFGFGGS